MQHPDDGARSTPDDRTPGAPHPDEGTIHAWLDDELPAAEADTLRAHLEVCASCRDAVAEARGLVAASARILRALDDGPGGVRGHSSTPPAAFQPTTSSALPVADAAGDGGVRSIGEARTSGVAGRGRRWRLTAIAAVGLMAVGTTLVMQRSGPLAPLTEERATAAATTTTAPADAVAATDSLAGAGGAGAGGAGAGGSPQSAAAAAAGVPAAAAAKAAVADQQRATAPAVAVPPPLPQSADVAVAASPTAPDSVAPGARSAFASPLQAYSGSAARVAGQAGVAGAPSPVAAEASLPVVREVGPVLTGRVLSTSGEPIGQALVTLAGTRNAAAVTDVEGRFRLAGMPVGEHTAVVRRLGFESARLPLQVAERGDSVVTVALASSPVTVGEVVTMGVATAPRSPEPEAESARRAVAAPSIIGAPVNPIAPAPAPPQRFPQGATPPASGAMTVLAAQRLAGCYRLEIGGAASADRDSAEAALPGWLRLLATPAAGRPGWLSVEPLLPARRDAAVSTGWRIGDEEEVEIVWPAAAAGREVVLRLRGSGEVLTGTAALRPVGGTPAVETEAASVVAVRGVCNQ